MIDTRELREKLRFVEDGELAPRVEAVQALKEVVLAVPQVLDELDSVRDENARLWALANPFRRGVIRADADKEAADEAVAYMSRAR